MTTKKGYPLKSLHSINSDIIAILEERGIKDTAHVLLLAQSDDQHQWSKQLNVSPSVMNQLIQHADLLRLRSVGANQVQLLIAAGVRGCRDLAERDPNILWQVLQDLQHHSRLAYHAPTAPQVRSWIAQAKELAPSSPVRTTGASSG